MFFPSFIITKQDSTLSVLLLIFNLTQDNQLNLNSFTPDFNLWFSLASFLFAFTLLSYQRRFILTVPHTYSPMYIYVCLYRGTHLQVGIKIFLLYFILYKCIVRCSWPAVVWAVIFKKHGITRIGVGENRYGKGKRK